MPRSEQYVSAMKALSDCRLYTFVDLGYLRGRTPEELTRALCEGGSDLIQLRAKDATVDEVRRLAERLLPITEAAGIGLVVNDHWQVALEIGAPYAHLGQEDFFEAGFRQLGELTPTGAALQFGLSSHAPTQAERAVKAGAAYLGVGPVFATATKPMAAPATLAYVSWAARHLTLPWFAIGGINQENLDQVLAAGARRICVISAILQEPDVVRACQAFKRRLDSAVR
jgi:thiamine-phosphate pyrophosphorylase